MGYKWTVLKGKTLWRNPYVEINHWWVHFQTLFSPSPSLGTRTKRLCAVSRGRSWLMPTGLLVYRIGFCTFYSRAQIYSGKKMVKSKKILAKNLILPTSLLSFNNERLALFHRPHLLRRIRACCVNSYSRFDGGRRALLVLIGGHSRLVWY